MNAEDKVRIENAENLKEMANLLAESENDTTNTNTNNSKQNRKQKPLVEHANFTHKFSDYNISPKDIIPLYLTKLNDK